MEVGEW